MSAGPHGELEAPLYQQILRLVAQGVADPPASEGLPLVRSVGPSTAMFHLRPDLWVKLERYEVCSGNEPCSLHAREAELLRILLRQPRCYIKAEVLAGAVGSENGDEPENPIEQMVMNIRRKSGETPSRPRLLLWKRHAGYAIFPDET